MVKKYLPSLILFGLLLVLPMTVFAAWDTLYFSEDSNIYLSGPNVTSTVSAGSKLESISVDSSSLSVTGAYVDTNNRSAITFTSAQRPIFDNSLGLATNCGSGSSSLTITWAATTPATVTVSVGGICITGGGTPSGGGAGGYATGGGGGAPAAPVVPTVPTTTSGEVTASASGGGKTTLITTEGAKATVELPVAAVSANTTVKVVSVTPAAVSTAAAPAPTGQNLVSAFNLTATSGGAAVTSFAKTVTVTFTYTDAQIAGLNEGSLKVYHWSGTQWVALPTTVNTATNTVTATTTSFSYFAIMGQVGVSMTVEQLKTEIARIMALILQLQAELAKLTGAVQSFQTDLSYGMKANSEVKRLQEFLISKGHLGAGSNTGNYFSLTEAAVKAYQKAKGITPVSGYFGPKTRAAVNTELGVTQ